jgi:hypothetical protein
MVSKGSTLTEIAKVIGLDVSTISRDLSYLEQQAQHNILNLGQGVIVHGVLGPYEGWAEHAKPILYDKKKL